MRKIFFIAVVVSISLANYASLSAYEKEIKSISSSIAENISRSGKKTIAVVDFTDLQGNVTELGRFLAEELSVDLTMTAKGFEVIDRNHLNRILAEHKLSISGIVDQKTVQKLGQIAGVDALVTGSITPLERSIRVVCKVIATDTARVISASKGDIAKTKAIEELFGKGVETGATTTPNIDRTAPQQPKTLPKAKLENFIFEAKGCKVSGQEINCYISIINNGENTRYISIYIGRGRSLLIDDFGNQYSSVKAQFADKKSQDMVNYNVPPNIPMNLILTYEGITAEARYANIVIDSYYGKASIRNIPLSK